MIQPFKIQKKNSNRSYFAYKLLFIYSNVILENFPKEKHILN